jgi:hypothetical protein
MPNIVDKKYYKEYIRTPEENKIIKMESELEELKATVAALTESQTKSSSKKSK